jgi:hypothetical protein
LGAQRIQQPSSFKKNQTDKYSWLFEAPIVISETNNSYIVTIIWLYGKCHDENKAGYRTAAAEGTGLRV